MGGMTSQDSTAYQHTVHTLLVKQILADPTIVHTHNVVHILCCARTTVHTLLSDLHQKVNNILIY